MTVDDSILVLRLLYCFLRSGIFVAGGTRIGPAAKPTISVVPRLRSLSQTQGPLPRNFVNAR